MGSVVRPVRLGATAPFTQKLSQSIPLTAKEISLLLELQSGNRFFRRGQEIIVEGRTYRTLFIIIEGVAVLYPLLPPGPRRALWGGVPRGLTGGRGCVFFNAL